MLSAFLQSAALALILEHEGGFVQHPKDPGGATKYGISLRAYPDLGLEGIQGLTKAEAGRIYWEDYWTPLRCSEMPPEIALAVFDAGVNQGVGAAARMLQRAAGVPVDGVLGPRTMQAVQQARTDALLIEFMARRAQRYFMHPNLKTFGFGWMRRLFSTFSIACKLQADKET